MQTEGAQGVLEAVLASTPGGNPTLRDLAHYRAKAQQLVGTPEQIADQLEQWQDAGIDAEHHEPRAARLLRQLH